MAMERWSFGSERASKQARIDHRTTAGGRPASKLCASGGGNNNWCVGFGHGIPVVCEKKLGVGAGDSQQVSVGV